ncbi:TIGR03758 family integrating conjugative element protein [Stutzerimonas stutzeri]
MTPEQISAFQSGAGYEHGQLALLISLIAGTVLFLFAAWTLLSAYRAWADRSLPLKKLGFVLLRIALLIAVVLTVIAI